MATTISGDNGIDKVANGAVDLTTDVTGSLPSANGGLPEAGTSGNVLTSNGTTWTSAALPEGGVTSLNGQSGAITDTTFGAIGSYVIGASNAFPNNTRYNGGETFAGSSLVRDNTAGGTSTTSCSLSGWGVSTGNRAVHGVSTASEANMGLSGTWRLMCGVQNGNIGSIGWRATGLFVRIS